MSMWGARGAAGALEDALEVLLTYHLSPSSHLQDLKDITHNVHYENYRIFRLNESHVLPRGPGWVNLAPAPASVPAPAGPQAHPGPSKVGGWAKDNSDEEC